MPPRGLVRARAGFYHLKSTFYVHSLENHVRRWTELSQAMRAHYYTNPRDQKEMYMISTYNPTTGNVVEVWANRKGRAAVASVRALTSVPLASNAPPTLAPHLPRTCRCTARC